MSRIKTPPLLNNWNHACFLKMSVVDFKEGSQHGTTPIYWGSFGFLKARVTCQTQYIEINRENASI